MSITVYFGPMFSGKTSKIRSDAFMYSRVFDKKCLFINWKDDDRGYMTHSGASFPVSFDTRTVENLESIKESGLNYDVILIDEAHFITNLYTVVRFWYENKRTVVVAGLVTRFDGEAIGEIPLLNHVAETYMQFKAKCIECGKEGKIVDASFTKRVVESNAEVLVGGADSYIAVCTSHFNISSNIQGASCNTLHI